MEAAPSRPWWPYVAPFAAFLVLTACEALLPHDAEGIDPAWYPVAYGIKLVVVAAVAWRCRAAWADLRGFPGTRSVVLSVCIGLGVTALWIGLDGHYPMMPFSGSRASFAPGRLSGGFRAGFVVLRMLGLVVLVPLIEELFWRSFLIRWVVRSDFRSVSTGAVTWTAAGVTSALFALAHPEWLPALIAGFAWAWLLRSTRSVTACVISHAVANLALAVYVLARGAWNFW